MSRVVLMGRSALSGMSSLSPHRSPVRSLLIAAIVLTSALSPRTTFSQLPPLPQTPTTLTISNFVSVKLGATLFEVRGTVGGAADSKVKFGGLLEGKETTVRTDGTFAYSFRVPVGASDEVTAQAYSTNGGISENEWLFIIN
ncbi:MAG: hypothetical protein ACKV0T_27265 [Planctomycetales bacterium]